MSKAFSILLMASSERFSRPFMILEMYCCVQFRCITLCSIYLWAIAVLPTKITDYYEKHNCGVVLCVNWTNLCDGFAFCCLLSFKMRFITPLSVSLVVPYSLPYHIRPVAYGEYLFSSEPLPSFYCDVAHGAAKVHLDARVDYIPAVQRHHHHVHAERSAVTEFAER